MAFDATKTKGWVDFMTKILSLWEPWASAMAAGWKKWETRSWSTPYRGRLVIHAAKTEECLDDGTPMYLANEIETQTGIKIEWPYPFPLGKVIAVVDLIDCVKTEDLKMIDPLERILGNYSFGRYAWKTENLRRIKPFVLRGKQGLTDLGVEAESALEFV